MTTTLYEHPLNERIRNYLKLEQLFTQVINSSSDCSSTNMCVQHPVFFNALFSIIDCLERNDIRGDLIKDLEKLEQNLVIWSKSPAINSSAITENLQQTVALSCQLKVNSPIWWQLKDDKFLASLKQRFAIQGGNASFDLPQLHFWIHQDEEKISHDIKHWSTLLDHIRDALFLILKFIRQRSPFEKIATESGFYQDSGEGILLLRIKLDQSAQYYPSVSGNRFRYSIRFMLPCPESGRRYSNQATKFELARC
jgi:cell division protein ZapD